ncbi:hypothetical protein TR80_008415 [Xanthomonas campestris]|nr:hypothetical protein TR80_008415 [Xanthomonas campestris]
MADSSSLRRTAPRTGVRSVGDGVGLGIGDWGLGIGESGIGNRESGAALQLGGEPDRHVTRRRCPECGASGGRRANAARMWVRVARMRGCRHPPPLVPGATPALQTHFAQLRTCSAHANARRSWRPSARRIPAFTPRASTRSVPADLRTAAGTAAPGASALTDAPRSAAGGGV